ncbi:MAG: diaminopimelate decarboxylase [Christensenellaceae bacterium]|jgi:diaminopimelate decarboxylase|nr:diaminopimelate decarboxylase [Christensenellaceae bacterium]
MPVKPLPFGKAQAQQIAAQYPTPFYLYDAAGIRRCVRALHQAFAWNKGYKEYFAVKALPNPAILRLLKEEGCGVDCASYTELLLAERLDLVGDAIMFSSNDTPAEEFAYARRLGAIVNLDDISHIEYLERHGGLPGAICCRYNPGAFSLDRNAIMGDLHDSKFGMTYDQLIEAMRILKAKGVQRFGLHAMLISCALDEGYYAALAEKMFLLALDIREQTGVTVSFIDLSGGIGIPYRPHEAPVDIARVGKAVRAVYERLVAPAGLEISLFSELGRFITGPYGYLVSTVLHEKHTHKDYIGLDATACNLMRPAIYGAYHHITALGKEDAPCTHTYDVTGSLCENNDKFAVDRMLPRLEAGDIVAIHDAGAHGYSMGYNYNGKLRCAELLLEEDGSVTLIRRAETPADYFATLDTSGLFGDLK